MTPDVPRRRVLVVALLIGSIGLSCIVSDDRSGDTRPVHPVPGSDTAVAAPATILMLNSYHERLPWSDRIVRSFLDRVEPDVEVYTEYLDTKRFVDHDYHEEMLSYLARKYAGTRFDVIVATDDAAYHEAIRRPLRFYDDTPIVFTGVNEFDPAQIADDPLVTGVAEITAIEETLDLIFELHRAVAGVYVVADSSLNGVANARHIRAYAAEHGLEDRFVFPNHDGAMTIESMAAGLREMPSGSVVYFSDFFVEPDGSTVDAAVALAALAEARPFPIYGHSGVYLGDGLLGGKVVTPQQLGEAAASIAGRILAGESPAAIPVVTESSAQYIFDAALLARHGIPRARLPEGTTLVNTPLERLGASHRALTVFLVTIGFLLASLIAIVIVVVIRRRANRELERERHLFQVLMDHYPEPIYFKDRDGVFLRANRAHSRHVGLDPDQSVVGRTDVDFYPAEFVEEQRQLEQRIMETGIGVRDNPEARLGPDGKTRHLLSTKLPYRSPDGKTVGIVGLTRDVTEQVESSRRLQTSLSEKEVLLREIHHRIKNNLQLIASMLNLQKNRIADAELRFAFDQAQLRVYTMAMVHEHLYQGSDVAALDLGEYLEAIFVHVSGLVPEGLHLRRRTDLQRCSVSLETAIHVGLIVTELITNAVQHAFPGRSEGTIYLRLRTAPDTIGIAVEDDGVGVPPAQPVHRSRSMGMQIVNALLEQLGGSLTIRNGEGTQCEVRLPRHEGAHP